MQQAPYPFQRRRREQGLQMALLGLVLFLLPFYAWGQAGFVRRDQVGLLNPLEYGSTCTTTTLQATIAAAPAHLGVLMLTPVDRNGTACVWAITSNLTIPTNLVLHVPYKASVAVSSGITLTLVRYPRQDNSDWITGAGTVTIQEPAPGGGGGGGGSGDITQVWGCTTGDCSALTAASGDSLDAGLATSSRPATRTTTLPATCSEGQMHQDTDSGGTETYICTSTNTWTKLLSSTDAMTDAQIPDLNTLSTSLTTNRCVETDSNGLLTVAAGACGSSSGDVTDVWGCTGGNCSALTGAAGDSLDAALADTSKPATRTSTLPGTCTEGQMHQDTDSGGTETYICTAANTWTKLMGTADVATDAQVPDLNTLSTGLTINRCVEVNGSGLLSVAAGACATGAGSGDITSVGNCLTGACLDGTTTGGSTLALYDGNSNKGTQQTANLTADRVYTWPDETGTVCTSGSVCPGHAPGPFGQNFTAQTTVTITGATHGRGTADLAVIVKDASSPRKVIYPKEITIDDSTFTVVVTFAVAQSGRVTIK